MLVPLAVRSNYRTSGYPLTPGRSEPNIVNIGCLYYPSVPNERFHYPLVLYIWERIFEYDRRFGA